MNPELLIRLLSASQPRRPKVIFNCLTGKRTVSVLYWALRYKLLSWLNVFPSLQWDTFNGAVNKLVQDKRVTVQSDGQLLSNEALENDELSELFPAEQRQVYRIMHVKIVAETTLLGIQALSHTIYHDMGYFPVSVSERARVQVRRWFRSSSFDENHIRDLTLALNRWLATMPARKADVFLSQLAGEMHPGYTVQQLSQALNLPTWQIDLIQAANLAAFAQFCQADTHGWRNLLSPFMDQALPRPVKQTLSAVQQGTTRTAISQQRGLRPSTINEHLLTAAILLPLDQFPYEKCVDEATRESIKKHQPVNIDNWQGSLGATPDQFFQYRMTQIWETKQK